MKLDIKLHAGPRTSEHRLELVPAPAGAEAGGGRLRLVLDREALEVDWVEISPGLYSIVLGDRSYEVWVASRGPDPASRQHTYAVTVGLRHYLAQVEDPRRRGHAGAAGESEGPKELRAPMPGKIVKILVSENQEVRRDEGLLVIEAMKMQNELRAPSAGRVEKIYVREGTGVETGFKLLRFV